MFRYTSDRYGDQPFETTPEEFEQMAAELGLTELNWHTDGERDYYTDQDGEIVLEEVAD